MREREIRQLRLNPVLRKLARRMAFRCDPVLVAQLWTGVDDPIEWFAEQMDRYWRHHHPSRQFDLEYGDSAARAVIAVYKEKREQLDLCSRL